jgi:hypothetical protein
MNKLLELQLKYLLNDLLNRAKRHNQAYVLVENDDYYLSMLIDIRMYKNDQIKFSFVRKNQDSSKYVLHVTNLTSDFSTLNVFSHIEKQYSAFFTNLQNFQVVDKNCSRKEFEKHYDSYFRNSKQLHSDKEIEFEMTAKKHISSYENNTSSLTKHLIFPRNEKEKRSIKNP